MLVITRGYNYNYSPYGQVASHYESPLYFPQPEPCPWGPAPCWRRQRPFACQRRRRGEPTASAADPKMHGEGV